ncbi:MAG: hypothetical protein GY754_44680 [bacterium]|nr:hypothetical protein [bacterium]
MPGRDIANTNNNTNPVKIALLGASFDTGNLGVSALAESSIKCLLRRWPNAEITLLGTGRELYTHTMTIEGRELSMGNLPIRFAKNIFLSNHLFIFYWYAILFKIFRWQGFKDSRARKNEYLKQMLEFHLVADITGGDSFSDIYGILRYTKGYFVKKLVLMYKRPLVFMPQTYGPFFKSIARSMARNVLKRAAAIFSRDREGVELLEKILPKEVFESKVQLIPDIAFTLDSRKPKKLTMGDFEKKRKKDSIVVGLNISGLLYNGGYTGDNMFNLSVDYQQLISKIIDFYMAQKKVLLILVPHVFPEADLQMESDPDACAAIYESLDDKYKDRVFVPEGDFDQNEIKYIVKQTDFFQGARMHSCIAALSQGIPTVGMAYSKKFKGVFETAGMEQYVADMNSDPEETILSCIEQAYKERKSTAGHLKKTIPGMKEKILNMFIDLELNN